MLLDTHAFLWWNLGDTRLSSKARRIMADPANTLFLSVASALEIAIKVRLGKLRLPANSASYVRNSAAEDHMEIVPIRLEHAAALQTLPMLHRDPFDRILIVQSQIEKLSFLTADPDIRRYAVDATW
ncbi:MAG TPA: type II toxin-antitoxin system VapC family toxin [Bryobacteraceae bacterium]|nr:type II toxin-antitoxin system VapC family toxin [Bryobacteraceae bacterium]